ncbi:glycoside hydrolase family 13 protein [Alkaliphilus transvaalensis]|uniref:glycoside hydrolase family 13 protein n=1 Tax=Alkaliphilus transvaalensis TaxID=114628 RepID=UPI00047E5646|nr:glycoside hydrolase family 13 protein [Alkaliphilus transvaalensis]
MNKHAIEHRPKSSYCYAYDEETIHIRLRAAKNDVKSVTLIYGDKYQWEDCKEIEMEASYFDHLFQYFAVAIKPVNNRLAYYFKIEGIDEILFYTEGGLVKNIDNKYLIFLQFQYPYLNKADIHITPDWVRDTVFYSIFPERFYNGNSLINPDPLTPWGQKPTYMDFYGGDLEGIIKKIEHLQTLGVNAIYLTPIFHSPTNHKYDTIDYFKVDPHFGDLDTLKRLVTECHQRNIKVVLDAVFNHSGYLFLPFQDVIEKGSKSKYYDWFHIKKWPIEHEPPSYDTFAFVASMPKLNTQNPEVREYLLKVGRYWIEEADIDGWRLDVSDEIDHEFWRHFRSTVRTVKPDIFIIGEVWHDPSPWLKGDQFDAVMNYTFLRNCIGYFANEELSDLQFKEYTNEMLMKNTQQGNEVSFNLLDSHDTPRFLTRCRGDIKKLLLAATFQLTFIGAPSIYYGTEIGMEGGADPDCRRTMEWNTNNWNIEIFNYYKNLLAVRRKYKALRRGNFKWENYEGILAYSRAIPGEKVIVMINNHNSIKTINFSNEDFRGFKDIYTEKPEVIDKLELKPYSSRIFIKLEKHN